MSRLGELHSKPRPWPLAWAALTLAAAAAAATASKQKQKASSSKRQRKERVVIITCADDHMPQIRTSAVNNTQNLFEKTKLQRCRKG